MASANQRKCIALGMLGLVSLASTALANPASSETFSVRVVGLEDETGTRLPITREQVARSIAVTQKRLKALGFPKPQISEKGTDGFLIRLEGLKPGPTPDIASALQKPGKLELKEVSPRNDELGPDGKSLAQRVQDGSEIVPGYRACTLKGKDEHGNDLNRPILVNRRAAIGNSDIASADPSPQQANAVAITLSEEGKAKMIALTQNMRPGQDRIAIVLDGEVISAPIVNQVPLGKQFIIEGFQQPGEVENLAHSLMTPLEFPLVIERERPAPANQDTTQ
jgi:preprotein translocase subunit SecD